MAAPLTYNRVTAYSGAPRVTLAQVKKHLNIYHDFKDDVIQGFLDSAVEEVDGLSSVSGRCLGTQTWDVWADAPRWTERVLLRVPDVQSIVSVHLEVPGKAPETMTFDNVSRTATTVSFDASAISMSREFPLLRVRMTVGIDPIPAPARTAILMRVQHSMAGAEPKVEAAWQRALRSFYYNPSTF
jgi:uncharacterized phiE125 gp8 family phage protein